GRVGASSTHELLSRTREVELPLARLELRGEGYPLGVLRPAHQLPGEVPGHLALEKLAAELRESLLQLPSRLVADLGPRFREDRPRVELRRALHQRYSGRGLAQNTARRGAIGLRHHARDLDNAALAKPVERLERAHRELRGPQEERPLC